jgi:hypothetical protein
VKINLWRLYCQATGYGQRPSEIIPGLKTELGRWYLDEACLVTGRRIQKLLDDGKDPFAPENEKKFRSAKGRKLKKVTIKPDGTW